MSFIGRNTALALLLCAAVPATAGIEVSLARDAAPENLLAGKNFDFGKGLAGWMNRRTNEVSCVEAEGRGMALFCAAAADKAAGQVFTAFRYVKFDPAWKGRTFILSCDIRPSAEVSSRAIPDSGSGLGCKVTFWSGDWKRSMGVGCMAEGPERWQKISSRPFEFPEWAEYMGVSAGLEYSKGSGFVDDIALEEAISAIDVTVASDAPIRQVKVAGDDGRILFDSGLIDGGTNWTRHIPTGSSRRVKVYAVDAEGDVAVAEMEERKGNQDAADNARRTGLHGAFRAAGHYGRPRIPRRGDAGRLAFAGAAQA